MVVAVDDLFYHSAAEKLVKQYGELHPEYKDKLFRVCQALGTIDIEGGDLLDVTIKTKVLRTGKLSGTASNSVGKKKHLNAVDCYNLIGPEDADMAAAVSRVFASV